MEHKDIVTNEVEDAASMSETTTESAPAGRGDVRISKKAILIFASIVLVVMLAYASRGLFIAAMVNGSPISRLSVIHALEKSGGKQALEGLVTQKIIADAVDKAGVAVSAAELKAETDRINDQVVAQGGTLTAALAQQGMTMDEFTKQITMQLELEKMLGDKVAVTDADVDAYITTNKLTIPKEKLALARTQIADQLKRDKINKEGQALVTSLRDAAKVTTFVQY